MAKSQSSIARKAANPGKKYDRVLLACTEVGCAEEFYVSKSSTPANRKCRAHFAKPPQAKQVRNTATVKMLRSLGFTV